MDKQKPERSGPQKNSRTDPAFAEIVPPKKPRTGAVSAKSPLPRNKKPTTSPMAALAVSSGSPKSRSTDKNHNTARTFRPINPPAIAEAQHFLRPQASLTSTPTAPMPQYKKLLYGTMCFFSVLLLIICGIAWNFRNSIQDGIAKASLNLGGTDDGATDILLVGLDSRTDAHGNPLSSSELLRLHAKDNDPSLNTDTIILLRIPTNGNSATAISLPRDSYVDIAGIGKAKLNSAYGSTYEQTLEDEVSNGTDRKAADKDAKQAGRKTIISTVENLTGVTIDHYAEIGLEGFAQLTDALGGVKVCLKNAVNDPFSGAHFHKGLQVLNGAQALSFVRQRHGLPREDLDRIQRQQVFMAFLAHHIISSDTLTNPSKISSLISAVQNSVVIDDGWNIGDFANRLSTLAGGQIRFATIPVEDSASWNEAGTQSVVKPDLEPLDIFPRGYPLSCNADDTLLARPSVVPVLITSIAVLILALPGVLIRDDTQLRTASGSTLTTDWVPASFHDALSSTGMVANRICPPARVDKRLAKSPIFQPSSMTTEFCTAVLS